MDTRHLQVLRELRDRGTLTAVAEATFRTPSAVSQQIRTAERELGVRLVEPDGRRLRLTDAGIVLAEGAEDVALAVERVAARLSALTGAARGTVRIGALPSAAVVLLPELLSGLVGSGIEVDLDDMDIEEARFAAAAHDYDIVIGHSLVASVPAGAEGLACTTLAREPIDAVLPAGHRLAGRQRIRAVDIADEPWVGVPDHYPFDTIRRSIEVSAGRPVRRVVRVRDNLVVASLVAAGLGVGLLPRYSPQPIPGLVMRPLADVPCRRFVVAISRPDRAERAAVRLVLDRLRAIGADVAARHATAVDGARARC